jgi:hypothetical protein
MKIKILALVVMLGIVGRVDAGFYTAGEILSDCESEEVDLQNDCVSYIAGIVDATVTWVAWGKMTKQICLPQVNVRQLRKVFIKYANERPEELHLAAGSLVLASLLKSFPCE